MNAIDIQNVSKTFRGKKGRRVDALRALTLDILPGEVFGFLGPNGAGKSTTIKAIMGLVKVTAGEIRVFGEASTSGKARKKIGYLPENPSFYDYLSAEEYLTFVARSFGIPHGEMQRRIEESLKLVELWEPRKRLVRTYSKGMVQRVGLAQVLVHAPDVLILDEPMSGLDPLGRALVKEIILDQKKSGRTVFFSTHITDDVEKVCDRVGVIVNGQLQALDSVDNLLKSGIEGYEIQLDKPLTDPLDGASEVAGTGTAEYYVPAPLVTEFMKHLGSESARLISMETKRRNLEAFFLEIVEKNSVSSPH